MKIKFPTPLNFSLSNGGQRPSPLTDPELATAASSVCFKRICDNACQHALERFRQRSFAWILIENLFSVDSLPDTPATFAPLQSSDWWAGAYAALAVIDAIKHRPVAYRSESSGSLFVNLAALPGEGRLAEKSRAGMRGHTDACSFPFPSEFHPSGKISPAPDLVVLIGYRNPTNVPTCLALLPTIMAKLPKWAIEELERPSFAIGTQDTFKTGHILSNAPILASDERRGRLIRFSHSKIVADPDFPKAEEALVLLRKIVAASFEDIPLSPGSLLLINNRTAIHGRREVGGNIGGQSRWLVRTYANDETTPGHIADARVPHLLSP